MHGNIITLLYNGYRISWFLTAVLGIRPIYYYTDVVPKIILILSSECPKIVVNMSVYVTTCGASSNA